MQVNLPALLLAAAAMHLSIDAPRELAGAAVLLDGAPAGALPADFSVLGAGPHTLMIRAEHYRPIEKRFHGGTASLRIRVLREEVVRTAAGGACRCVRGDYAPSEQWTSATAIFRGRVAAIDPIPAAERISELRMKITFDVVKQWLGAPERRIAVSTWEEDGPYCGFGFQRGVEYLVWAWGPKGGLLTDACTRTRPVAEAADDIRWLTAGDVVEPHRRPAKLDRRDVEVIAAALRPPRAYEWCSPNGPPPATAPATAWYRHRRDVDELPERIRQWLEEQGHAALANLAPRLVAAVVDRNDRQVAPLRGRRGRASVTLPAYDESGTTAVLYVEIDCRESSNPAAFVFLRRQRSGWRAVAFAR